MGIDSVPMQSFLEAMAKWLIALKNRHTEDAAFQVRQMRALGQMLTADPEFQRILREHVESCPVENADDALACMCTFLDALTDAARPGRFRSA